MWTLLGGANASEVTYVVTWRKISRIQNEITFLLYLCFFFLFVKKVRRFTLYNIQRFDFHSHFLFFTMNSIKRIPDYNNLKCLLKIFGNYYYWSNILMQTPMSNYTSRVFRGFQRVMTGLITYNYHIIMFRGNYYIKQISYGKQTCSATNYYPVITIW